MSETEAHAHRHPIEDWPFGDAPTTAVFTSSQVFQSNAPILLVFHDHDGEWQLLHGPVTEGDECHLVCFGCAFDRDESIGALNALPIGWRASRTTPASPWELEPYEDSDAD